MTHCLVFFRLESLRVAQGCVAFEIGWFLNITTLFTEQEPSIRCHLCHRLLNNADCGVKVSSVLPSKVLLAPHICSQHSTRTIFTLTDFSNGDYTYWYTMHAEGAPDRSGNSQGKVLVHDSVLELCHDRWWSGFLSFKKPQRGQSLLTTACKARESSDNVTQRFQAS